MSRSVPVGLRQRVTVRAQERCEYCRFPQAESFFTFEMEHIIAEKHGGPTTAANLALACPFCNRAKGSDLGSLDPETGILTAFFHPRTQQWADHFRAAGVQIMPLTPEGRVTARILQFNHPDRLAERQALQAAGVNPLA